uniref:F-box domain-containing protein n=1 Tax=Oryza meridionalis TaxID=40149 RepID=A0A0E0F7D3_9ORYZ
MAAVVVSASDWSRLPDDMLIEVMRSLEIPDLLSAGAVCSSWRPAYTAVRRVRLPITDKSPCLLYSCDDAAAADDDVATVYSPSSGATFKLRLPGPAFRRRYTVGSDHGWIVTADELSNLQVINPLSGVQIDLPPVTELYNVESFIDEQGNLMYNNYEDSMHRDDPLGFPVPYPPQRLRLFLYFRVILSCSPSAGSDCVVLLLHSPDGQLSFARIGDHSWTRLTDIENLWDRGYRCAVYNKNDRLF